MEALSRDNLLRPLPYPDADRLVMVWDDMSKSEGDPTFFSTPAVAIATLALSRQAVVLGAPDPRHISTSYVERQNLTMRMSMRRFTRLTNAFSNHAAAIALYFMYYNFGRIHQTLRVTPAMEAGVANHVWSVEKIIGLLV